MRESPGASLSVSTDDPVLADLVERVTAQIQAGQSVDLKRYAQEFPEHAAELRELLPALQALAGVGASESVASAPAPSPTLREPGLVKETLGDFRIVREIGRGGMGVVYEAQQVSLNRRVALKVLPAAAALDPRHLQRFKIEAQAAAHLHHAHIVPIFAVGCDRGIHYYAMQFIEARTLAQVIADLKSQTSGSRVGVRSRKHATAPNGSTAQSQSWGPDNRDLPQTTTSAPDSVAGERSVTAAAFFRAVAKLGVEAAEALEYAHQTGVIHRDIKPNNLLVDGRGRLWITDFGLARFGADAELTQTGDVIGTLRYMSPEQALARRGLVDHRTDVYALGATLYELLTLEPACPGRDRKELLWQIAWEEPRPLRHANRAVPADLETILLKALAKDVTERYATAQDLADDLRRFLEDKPIQARRPTVLARALKWARRHRTTMRAAAVVLLLTSVGLALCTWLIARQRDRADLRGRQARRAVDRMYIEFGEKWLSQQPYLEEVQRDFLLEALAFYEAFAQEESDDPSARLDAGRAYRRAGDIHHRLGEPERADAAYTGGVVALKALAQAHPDLAEARDELAVCLNHRGHLLRAAGRLQDAVRSYREALTLFAALSSTYPDAAAYRDGLAGSSNNLGMVWHALGKSEDADRIYRQALALFERLAAEVPRKASYRFDLAGCLNNLGYLQRDLGQSADAEKAFEQAREICIGLVSEFPSVPAYRQALGAVYDNLGLLRAEQARIADADTDYDQALSIRAALARDFPRAAGCRHELARTHHHRGLLFAAARQSARAEEAYCDGIRILEALVRDAPSVAAFRCELAAQLGDLGSLMEAEGRVSEAEKASHQAVALLEPLVTAQPEVASNARMLAVLYYRAGEWQKALSVLERTGSVRAKGNTWEWLMRALAAFRLGNKEEAQRHYARAVEVGHQRPRIDADTRRLWNDVRRLIQDPANQGQ